MPGLRGAGTRRCLPGTPHAGIVSVTRPLVVPSLITRRRVRNTKTVVAFVTYSVTRLFLNNIYS